MSQDETGRPDVDPEDTLAGTGQGVPSRIIATTAIAIHRRIGQGGLGEVYTGSDRATGRNLAVKFLNGWALRQYHCLKAFRLEAAITSQLEHPNIVPVYAVGDTPDGQPFYAMRLIPGRTFGAAIAELHERPFPQDTVDAKRASSRQLLAQFVLICKAIAYAHNRGIVHRDIKPANVMLGKFGEVVVLDWGLAVRIDRDERARSSGEYSILLPTLVEGDQAGLKPLLKKEPISGTPAYMSPEQHEGMVPGHEASDVYSLGATLYHLLTGQPPFLGDLATVRERVLRGDVVPPLRLKKDVSRTMEAICLKAMARNPAERYESALELAHDVENHLADLPVVAHRETLLGQAARWTRRNRTLTLMGVVTALLLLLTLGVALLLLQRKASEEHRAWHMALEMAARLAASTAAQQINLRSQILERESRDPALIAALSQVAGAPASGGGAKRWPLIQTMIEEMARANQTEVEPESWVVCDARGLQVARFPEAETIGNYFPYRDYFHGRGHDLKEGETARPLREFHRSAVYKSKATRNLKVAFSSPIWQKSKPGAGEEPLGVLVMTFDLGELFDSFDAMSSTFALAVVDLREDHIDGEAQPGLLLQNHELLQTGQKTERISPKTVAWSPEAARKLLNSAQKSNTSAKTIRWLEEASRGGPRFGTAAIPLIVDAEWITVVGRPHMGWAVLILEAGSWH